VILTALSLGWKTITFGVIISFDKAAEVGTPVFKNIVQEAKEYVYDPQIVRMLILKS
jgi:hypothetical protein